MFTPIDFTDFDFLQHYRTFFEVEDRPFSYYEAAYRYGYDLAYGYRYRNANWERMEPDARAEWERRHRDQPWEEIWQAVYYAWEHVKRRSSIG